MKLTIGGPLLVSHLTIGGRIQCLYNLKPIYYKSTDIPLGSNFKNSYINRVYGILPIYVGTSFLPVFITTVGPKITKSSMIYFPFFEILIPCVGFSIAFVYTAKNSQPVVLFEYNLDACFIGVIAGF